MKPIFRDNTNFASLSMNEVRHAATSLNNTNDIFHLASVILQKKSIKIPTISEPQVDFSYRGIDHL